ncbi:aminotransferase class IV [Acuticoccus sediminis]|nr:aminotransferase class IV [Acuticoccus sediminis]
MGGAVFEGMRAYDGRIFLGEAHLERLAQSAEWVGYGLPRAKLELTKAVEAVLWANALHDAYVRPVAWRGSESASVAARGASVHIAIAAWDWPTPAALGRSHAGIRLQLATWRRPRPDTAPTASKCSGLYMIGTLARHAALDAGFDDALMLDAHDHVAETTSTNVVLVKGETLISPVADCFLDGITERHVFALASRRGLAVEERRVRLEDLRRADEVFVAGTSVEIQPVVELMEGERRSRWPVGPITRALIADFQASVRERRAVGARALV